MSTSESKDYRIPISMWGFTLVELLTAGSMIALLIALLLPGLGR